MPFNLAEFPEAFDAPNHLTHNSAWIYHIPMVPVILRLLRPNAFVELGTFRGDSYMAFCQTVLKAGLPTQCTAIDTWRGDAHAGFYGPQILELLRQAHDPRYGAFSTLKQATFDEAVGTFADGSIDLLHIDGLHTYEAVKHDFETWRPKLSDRGVVLFHDTTIREKGFGVWKLWEEVSAGRPHFNVPYGCGLGLLAVGNAVPAEFLEFLGALERDHATILPPMIALGRRNELLRSCLVMVKHFEELQDLANQWRTLMGQTVHQATPSGTKAWEDPVTYSAQATKDVAKMAGDAVQLLTEINRLKRRAMGMPRPMPHAASN